MRIALFSIAGLVLVTLLLWLSPPHAIREAFLNDPAYRADRLFKRETPDYSRDIHRLAQRIEWGDSFTASDFTSLGDRINQRHGQDITLLFHAVGAGNLSAIDALLAAGADTTMLDKTTGSTRNFVYFLTLPGGPLLDMDEINEMLASYLRHGGNPNATWGDPAMSQGNLPAGLALSQNIDGLRMVIDAGGDPWKDALRNGEPYNNAVGRLASREQFAMLDELIDKGWFDDRSQAKLHSFLRSLGGYAQRGDETSREIQRIAMRVLKRNPHYMETTTQNAATRRIFKNHWQDPIPGVIPWDRIRSDEVN